VSPLPCPLATVARLHGEACAVETGTERITYAQLDRRVTRLVAAMRGEEIAIGSRIGLVATADIDVIVAVWALLRAGATVCPLNPRWPSGVVEQASQQADVERVVGASDLRKWLKRDPHDVPPALSGDSAIEATPATIIFSSGSSGTPKAIAHELEAHLASARGANQNLPLAAGDRWLLSLPLFHVSGLGILFRCTLAGATIVVPEPELALDDQVRQQRPTHLSLVPTQLIRWMDQSPRPPQSLQAVLLGGAPLPTDLIRHAHAQGWPLLTTYGLSEMASQVTTTLPGCDLDELRTSGHVLAGREMMIGPDEEIRVRGSTLMAGYVQGRQLQRPLDAGGWFHTGDLGRWDSAGRLVVIGRRDHLFISGGENVYPEEIELALLDLPGVQQAIVVPVTCREYGQRPVAFVDGDLKQVESWREALARRLPRYKLPDLFLAWPPSIGLKPDRRELKRLAGQHFNDT
jgi:o-succinylbenzoate---CoA ligase